MSPLHFTERIDGLRQTAVNRVLRDVRAAEAAGKTVVSLMRGQPDSPTPHHIVTAAKNALDAGRTGYPDNQGEPALRRAVATRLRRDHGLDYDPNSEILITDGATCGIAVALAVLVQAGDEVLLPDPIYDAYVSPLALWGASPRSVASTIRAGRFTIDRAALERAYTPKAKVLLLNTPWNPVGTVFTRAELEEMMGFAEGHNLFVLSDEIYETLVYDGRHHISPAAVLPAARNRTLMVNSLSKTYAMTGWRVGYCAGPAELIRAMVLVLQQWSRGPATFVQDAAACALLGDQECVRRMCAEYQGRRDRVTSSLAGIPGVEAYLPGGGLFVMVDIRGLGRTSDEVRQFLLQEAGVVVIHGAAYGPGGEGTLRVSFAAGDATLDRGLELLRGGLLRLAEPRPRKEL